MIIPPKKHTGYIEGYYGRMLTWEQRAGMVRHLGRLKMNTYVYAPKEDPWHRQCWKTPYPAGWMKDFSRWALEARAQKVNVVPGIAPGLSFDYLSRSDYGLLLKKAGRFCKAGIRTIALLMDDISEDLPKHCRKSFKSLGEAHGALLGSLQKDLTKKYPGAGLWFCPTVYTDRFAGGDASSSPYLTDLRDHMPVNVPVFWTGPDVVSETITAGNIAYVSGLFKNRLLIWDNFYANDYCQARLFLAPPTGRPARVYGQCAGFMQNPTGLYEVDRICLSVFAADMKGAAGKANWKKLLSRSGVPDAFFSIHRFFLSPFASFSPSDFSTKKLEEYRKALRHLLFTWKSPLQMEMYPFLNHLLRDVEMCMAEKGKKRDPRLMRKYTPVMANMLEQR